VPDNSGGWAVADTLAEARSVAGKVQGRRTTVDARPPLDAPPGDWDAVLRTPWVEPAYLETDAAWCEPGGEPAGPLANGGAFGGKAASGAPATARRLADQYGRPVLVLLSREDTVRNGPKRPPVSGGATADGRGVLRVVRTPGIAEVVATVAPKLAVVEVDVPGPPTSTAIRAAGWAEALVLLAGARGTNAPVVSPDGAVATAEVDDSHIEVAVRCGDPLDELVLRSYCVGAAHMAWSWVTSEALAVSDEGTPLDLTVRSFGVVRATETPRIEVRIEPDGGEPTNGSDAVFTAGAAATWLHRGTPADWPTGP
jgi:nucleotide-binding universal stress UspA family protein